MGVFVFGSNKAGRHGKGAALFARQNHGAIYGKGSGIQGNSYGIITKTANLTTCTPKVISYYVSKFIKYAEDNSDIIFDVTAIGCGLAGYKPSDIAPMFKNAPSNCNLPKEFKEILFNE
jgi:hypothetical protein